MQHVAPLLAREAESCLLCLGTPALHNLCQGCRQDLPWQQLACRCCGLPLEAGTDPEAAPQLCRPCRLEPPPFQRAEIPLLYAFPVDRLIGRYKFSGHRPSGRLLARQLIQQLRQRTDPLPELLIPCPMHRQRFYQRGFNQSAELAEWLGQALGIPVAYDLCTRPKATRAQVGQQREARLRNLRQAFRLEGQPPLHVALVDDVVTTGATLHLLAGLLKEAGAEQIEIWALARTPAKRATRQTTADD